MTNKQKFQCEIEFSTIKVKNNGESGYTLSMTEVITDEQERIIIPMNLNKKCTKEKVAAYYLESCLLDDRFNGKIYIKTVTIKDKDSEKEGIISIDSRKRELFDNKGARI